jgi:hypothetical protein
MCCILFTTSSSVCYVVLGIQVGLRGDIAPMHGGSGVTPSRFFFPRETRHILSSFFMLPQFLCPLLGNFLTHGFFSMVHVWSSTRLMLHMRVHLIFDV